MNSSPFITLMALGKIYNVGARDVGSWLKKIGLRDEDGRPSQKAHQEGFVREQPLDYGGFFYLWHEEKTRQVLDRLPKDGYGPLAEQHDGFVLIRGGR